MRMKLSFHGCMRCIFSHISCYILRFVGTFHGIERVKVCVCCSYFDYREQFILMLVAIRTHTVDWTYVIYLAAAVVGPTWGPPSDGWWSSSRTTDESQTEKNPSSICSLDRTLAQTQMTIRRDRNVCVSVFAMWRRITLQWYTYISIWIVHGYAYTSIHMCSIWYDVCGHAHKKLLSESVRALLIVPHTSRPNKHNGGRRRCCCCCCFCCCRVALL